MRFFDISNVSAVKEIAYFKPPAQGTKALPGSQYAGAVPATFMRNYDMATSKPSFPKDRGASTGDVWMTAHDNGLVVVKLDKNATASTGGGCASTDASSDSRNSGGGEKRRVEWQLAPAPQREKV